MYANAYYMCTYFVVWHAKSFEPNFKHFRPLLLKLFLNFTAEQGSTHRHYN